MRNGESVFGAEDALVDESHRTNERARYLLKNAIPRNAKGGWLADAAMAWDRLASSGNARGALTPTNAKATLTRDGRRLAAERSRWTRQYASHGLPQFLALTRTNAA